jgi:hypothetical protein
MDNDKVAAVAVQQNSEGTMATLSLAIATRKANSQG